LRESLCLTLTSNTPLKGYFFPRIHFHRITAISWPPKPKRGTIERVRADPVLAKTLTTSIRTLIQDVSVEIETGSDDDNE
jgi:hypothetical protein